LGGIQYRWFIKNKSQIDSAFSSAIKPVYPLNIQINFLWQIEHEGKTVTVDPVLFSLLTSLDQLGSLQQAALQCQTSYRHAWGLMEKGEKLFGSPLIIKHRGRGAKLTEAGEKLLQAQRQLQARHAPQLANQATELAHQLSSIQQAQKNYHLRIYASHGLAVSALRDTLNQLQDMPVELHFHGSLESLRALKENQCDIAGFHVPEGELGKRVSSQYLQHISPENHRLIYLVRRLQGLMVPKDNPLSIHSLADLSKGGYHFINRQKDSGTRLLLDQLLDLQHIDPMTITGYKQEEFTHMAVAAMVASGAADCGFGIAAAAQKFGLNFVPIQWEHYCLAVNQQQFEHESVQTLFECVNGHAFQNALVDLEGYQLDRCGQEVAFEQIFGKGFSEN